MDVCGRRGGILRFRLPFCWQSQLRSIVACAAFCLAVPLATVKYTKTGSGYGYLSRFPTTWFLKWGTAVDVEDHVGRLHLDGV